MLAEIMNVILVNKITKDSNCLFGLGRFLRPPGVPAAKFFSKWEKIKQLKRSDSQCLQLIQKHKMLAEIMNII